MCALATSAGKIGSPHHYIPDVARGVPLIAVMAAYPDSHDLYGLEEVRVLHMGGRSAVGVSMKFMFIAHMSCVDLHFLELESTIHE